MTDTPELTPKPEGISESGPAGPAGPPESLPERVLADIGSPGGPLLLVTFQVHGNEPAGKIACQRVLDQLAKPGAPALSGRLIAICGNPRATAEGVRRIDRDLNRVFPPGPLSGAPAHGPAPAEHLERDAFIGIVKQLKKEHAGQSLWFLDLHTTSSESIPYLSLPSDDAGSLTFAGEFPLHRVTGFASIVQGTIDRYLFDQGFIGFACEGGQHQRNSSASNMEALIWLMLEETSMLTPSHISPGDSTLMDAHAMLEKFLLHRASHFRVVHRHSVEPSDSFVMEPGFANFSEVRPGQMLAHDRNGPILCPRAAHLLMPLYQPTGSDGFFLVEEQ